MNMAAQSKPYASLPVDTSPVLQQDDYFTKKTAGKHEEKLENNLTSRATTVIKHRDLPGPPRSRDLQDAGSHTLTIRHADCTEVPERFRGKVCTT